METKQSAAGWYPDPQGPSGQMRYWDGAVWTGQVKAENVPQAMPQNVGANYATPATAFDAKKNNSAIAGLVLGLVGFIAWIIPLIGYAVCIVGIVFSAKGLKSEKKGLAIAGLILNIVALVFTFGNSVLGAMLSLSF